MLSSFEPVTRSATFCSSTTFQLIYSSISGGSSLGVSSLAARRVVPPDLIAPALLSPIFKNDINPDDFPPPLKGSLAPLMLEKFEPVPEPYLNKRASRTHRSIIPPSFTRSSVTDWIKHACGWGCVYASDEVTSPPDSASI